MAPILRIQGNHDKAAAYEESAQAAKAELERKQVYPQAPDEEQSWDCFLDLVAR